MDLNYIIGELERLSNPKSGFIPDRTPLIDLPPPFQSISEACTLLPSHYHGDGYDCRPWLDAEFAEPQVAWIQGLEQASTHLVENLMTKVSLLCHAYRWQGMPTDPENYKLEEIFLPQGLEWLWDRLAQKMNIIRVGIFYTMVCNNWKLDGVGEGEEYDINQISEANIKLIHPWLNEPEAEELRNFIVTALGIEAKGVAVVQQIQQIYQSILNNNDQEATYQLLILQAKITQIYSTFNSLIKTRRMKRGNFLKFIQPTMIWMLDHGDGPLEGASGPQCCTIQLLDCFFGVPKDSGLGEIIEGSRKYMMPDHRELLGKMEDYSGVLKKFVLESKNHRLLDVYNRCVQLLFLWRVSHQKRASLYIKGEKNDKPRTYVSTGMVVKNEENRAELFEKTMQGHINETKEQLLEDIWEGKENSIEYLFRFLATEKQQELLESVEKTTLPIGEAIINQGDIFPGIFYLDSGTATVEKSHKGELHEVASIGANEIFGEMSLIENLPASATVRVKEEGVVCHLSLENIYRFISKDPRVEKGFYLALAQTLSNKLRRML